MLDPTLQMAALATLERLINQALRLDPATQKRLATLSGQIFHLQCSRAQSQQPLEVFVLPQSDGVTLAGFYDGKITAGLSGSASDYAKLLSSKDPAAELINGNLIVRGDSNALQQLQRIAADLDLDWEAPLTRIFGDVIGFQLGRGLRHLASRALYAGKQLQRQVHDYVNHESNWLATQHEVNRFNADVESLSLRSERFETQLKKFQTQVKHSIEQRPARS